MFLNFYYFTVYTTTTGCDVITVKCTMKYVALVYTELCFKGGFYLRKYNAAEKQEVQDKIELTKYNEYSEKQNGKKKCKCYVHPSVYNTNYYVLPTISTTSQS